MNTPTEATPTNVAVDTSGKEVVPEKWRHLPIAHLIHSTDTHVVFLDHEGDLDWETSPACDQALRTNLKPGELSRMRNRVAVLQAYPVEYLSSAQVRTFRIMVGEGVARGHSCDVSQAISMLDAAKQWVIARNQEVARIWYLEATYKTCGVFLLIGLIGWMFRQCLAKIFGADATHLLVISSFGAIGALFFILLRVGKTPLDPAVGRQLHIVEGMGRIFVGVIGAAIAQLAMKVGLLVPFLSQQGTTALLLVAIIAGASERLVPSLIGRVEAAASNDSNDKSALQDNQTD